MHTFLDKICFILAFDLSKKHTVVLKKTSRGIFENVQCFFKTTVCQENGSNVLFFLLQSAFAQPFRMENSIMK